MSYAITVVLSRVICYHHVMNISRSRIKTIGKKIRLLESGERLSARDLIDLTAWRDSHAASLSYFMKLLEKELLLLGVKKEQFSLTQRLKRIYSIRLKLNRFNNMQLSMMDDIAGARAVIDNLEDTNSLYQALKEKDFKYSLLKVNNYISIPKDDGYRSIHLVYRTNKNPSIQIELQLRTHLQHIWATAVEVFGTIVSTSFKTGEGEGDWRNFFRLLSSRFAIYEKSSILAEHEALSRAQLDKSLIKLIKDLNIIEQLNTYTSVYNSSWKEKRGKGRMGKYALLILDNIKNTTEVEFFSEQDRLRGLERYSELESNHIGDDKLNSVFISVDDMTKLEEAYPNYFMDTKLLTNYLSRIVVGKF